LPVTRKSTPATASTEQPRKRSTAAKPAATATDTPAKAPRRVATKAVAEPTKPAKAAASRGAPVPVARKPARASKLAVTPAGSKPAAKATAAKPARAAKPAKAASASTKVVKEAKPKPASTRATTAAPKAKPAGTRARKPVEKPIDERVREAVVARLDSMKAVDLKEIDVRGKTSVTDCIVIATGTSTRHVKSMADEVVVTAKKLGMMPLGVEGEKEAEWVLVDLGDTVIHVMLPRTREFYALERLWTMAEESRATPA
jgi:ribosome silencing factor RsfS/YbeB/iojap